MEYLLVEIVVYLVGAGLIGFVSGWILRAELIVESAAKRDEKLEEVPTKVSEEKVAEVSKKEEAVKEEKVAEVVEETKTVILSETVEEVTEPAKEAIAEVVKEEAPKVEKVQPTLFAKAPAKGSDDLSALKGLGPALEKKLNNLGIYTYEQIASWTPEQEIWVGTQVAFPNKVVKEAWVQQAKDLLASK